MYANTLQATYICLCVCVCVCVVSSTHGQHTCTAAPPVLLMHCAYLATMWEQDLKVSFLAPPCFIVVFAAMCVRL